MNFLKTIVKLSFLFALVFAMTTNLSAQDDKSKRKSPPMEATGMIGDVEVNINYGAPSVRERTIFGELESWDKVWRTGANESTTFEVSKNVLIEGQELAAGKYSLFTIPSKEDKWTVIFNSVPDQWGAFNYDKNKDVLRVEVMAKTLDELVETMTFKVKEKEDGKGWAGFSWEKTKVGFSIAPVASN